MLDLCEDVDTEILMALQNIPNSEIEIGDILDAMEVYHYYLRIKMNIFYKHQAEDEQLTPTVRSENQHWLSSRYLIINSVFWGLFVHYSCFDSHAAS